MGIGEEPALTVGHPLEPRGVHLVGVADMETSSTVVHGVANVRSAIGALCGCVG